MTDYPKNADFIFDSYIDFLEKSGAKCVCFAQGGDLIGGANDFFRKKFMRKAMNAFFCKTARKFKFVGRMNDDVNTYLTLGHKGNLLCTAGEISVVQAETQQQSGGLTDMYKENGTYMKSFYSVMMCPSAVKVGAMNTKFARIHHRIDWNRCASKILHQRHKKV